MLKNSKFLLGVMVVAILFMGAFALVTTKANAEAQAIITVADVQYAATVRLGSSGQAALIWQRFLNGYSTTAQLVEDGKFGPLSTVQAKAWQASKGLVADGVMGPLSRAAAMAQIASGAPASAFPAGCTSTVGYSSVTGLSCAPVVLPAGCSAGALFSSTTGLSCAGAVVVLPAGCTTSAGFSPTTGASCAGGTVVVTGPLAGTSGEISDLNQISSISNEEIGDGSNDVKVMGFDLVTSNDGDIALRSIKLTFDGVSNGGSTRLEDYLDSVSVLMGSTVIATSDTSDFTKDSTGVYSKTFTLSNAVVRSDTTAKIYVTVDAVSNLDSGDIATTVDDWEVGIANIRYEDGGGVVTTMSAAEVNTTAGNLAYETTGDGVAISFVSFSTSADTELKFSLNNTPIAQVVKVSATADSTTPLVLLKGKMKLEGTSDVLLDSFPILITTSEGDLIDVTPNAYLTLGSEEFSESITEVAASETVVFNDLDYTITAGSTVNFTVSVDLNDIQSGTFDEGTTLKAELRITERDGASFVGENEQGDALVDITEKTGTALGELQTFRSTGINVVLVNTTATVAVGGSGAKDIGTYTTTFDVTAFGGDMYIDGTKPLLAGTNSADLDLVQPATAAGTIDSIITSSTGAVRTLVINDTAVFLVVDGTTERFTITTVVTPVNAGGLYAVSLTSLPFGTDGADITDATVTTGTAAWEYTTNLTDFVSPSVNLKLTN